MSLCNLGRPPQDAGLQNLIVNDTLRVNKLLKSTKAEVDRLCADIAIATSQSPTVFEGSFTGTGLSDFENYQTWAFPVGSSFVSSYRYTDTPFTFIWTDEALVIDDFRAVATAESGGDIPTPINFTLGIVAVPVIGAGAEIITIPFTGVTSTPVSQISSAVPVTIPAGSYVSIGINMSNFLSSFKVSWSIRLQKA